MRWRPFFPEDKYMDLKLNGKTDLHSNFLELCAAVALRGLTYRQVVVLS